MSRIAFIFRTDVHAADHGPHSWKGDYPAEIRNSLTQIGELAREHKTTTVLDNDDFFHVKRASQNSHGLLVDIGEIHQKYPCPVYSIEGNHDLKGNNLDSVSHQPLGVLYKFQLFRHLRDETFTVDGLRVRVVGFPYSSSRTVREIQEIRKKDEDYLVAIVHALAAEDPPAHVEDFFGEPVLRYSQLVYENGPDAFLFGHWHKDQGIVQIEGRYFVNQGAVSRGALIRENTQRTPQVALLEFTPESMSVRTLSLTVAPATEVFDFERKERQDREATVINHFVTQLESDLLDSLDDTSADYGIATMSGIDAVVRSKTLEYLEKART